MDMDCERLVELLSYAICGGGVDGGNPEEILTSAHNTCYELMARDYCCDTLNNSNSQLCSTYPSKIIVPVSCENEIGVSKLVELIHKCRFARTRGRFAVPVLLLDGKYVCRSSTLARSPEIYCRSGYGYWIQGDAEPVLSTSDLSLSNSTNGNALDQYSRQSPGSIESLRSHPLTDENTRSREWMLDKVRNADINLLCYLKVDTIFDLMVEKKKVKFGMNVTSSEKVDRQQRYLNFNLLSVPYPGCEFFAQYRDCDYVGEGLKFDWKQNFVDADLSVTLTAQQLADIDWQDYINWDLIKLTQNYLKLQLCSLLHTKSTGILLHCISGWDRTPLFVSLLRMSLWADGLIHQSLSPEEMVYFTVAYDWVLFSHQFPDRISKGEEIFYFCFDFLKYIEHDEFSMVQYNQLGANNGLVKNGADRGHNFGKTASNPQRDVKNLSQNGCVDLQHDFEDTSSVLMKFNLQNMKNDPEHKCECNASNISSYVKSSEGNQQQGVAVMSVNHSSHWSPKKSIGIEGASKSAKCSPHQPSRQPSICTELSDRPSAGAVVGRERIIVSLSEPNMHASLPCGSKIYSPKECPQDYEMSNVSSKNSACVQGKCSPKNDRSRNLRRAREFLVPAYRQALQEHQEREQRNNSGFAAALFNHLTKTLSFVKR